MRKTQSTTHTQPKGSPQNSFSEWKNANFICNAGIHVGPLRGLPRCIRIRQSACCSRASNFGRSSTPLGITSSQQTDSSPARPQAPPYAAGVDFEPDNLLAFYGSAGSAFIRAQPPE